MYIIVRVNFQAGNSYGQQIRTLSNIVCWGLDQFSSFFPPLEKAAGDS